MHKTVDHGSRAVMETRLTHETHRLATGLLVDSADRTSTRPEALAALRDFIVTHLRHHHETEDALLWPRILAAAPETAPALDRLSEEHDRLDAALERLAALDITGPEKADGDDPEGPHRAARLALREAAVAVRDSVRDHLAHEEPVLFPALRVHITPAQWTEFAHQVITTTPPVAGHLAIGFLDEAGTPAEVESMLADMPPAVRELLPAMRSRAAEDLRDLRRVES